MAALSFARAEEAAPTIGEWLRQRGESKTAIERFWSVVLVSALGESVERASLAAARKVFVDGFMSARAAYEMHVPAVPLGYEVAISGLDGSVKNLVTGDWAIPDYVALAVA